MPDLFASPWSAIALFTAGLCAQDHESPTVLSLTPAHLAAGVGAETTECVVRFDRDMDRKAFAVGIGGPAFPRVTQSGWRDARTFAMRVELEPDHVYVLDLSAPGTNGFVDKAGQRLEHTPWRFATAGPPIARAEAERTATTLFRLLAEQYSYRDRLGIEWSDFQTRSIERIATAGNMSALVLEIANVLAVPQDPHITLGFGATTLPTFQPNAILNYDERGLRAVLPGVQPIGSIGMQARTDDGIGYLQIRSFARESVEEFNLCITALRAMKSCTGVVIDVRTNTGGDEALARRIAGFFVDGQKTYAATRTRDPRAPGGFTERQDRIIRPNPEAETFRGPVMVLMGQYDMATCESFLLMMLQAPKVELIGSRSYGSSGNPRPYLVAPGITVMLPSWQALRPNGSCFEGEGIEPTVPITATPAAFVTGDPVLEEALARLRNPR